MQCPDQPLAMAGGKRSGEIAVSHLRYQSALGESRPAQGAKNGVIVAEDVIVGHGIFHINIAAYLSGIQHTFPTQCVDRWSWETTRRISSCSSRST